MGYIDNVNVSGVTYSLQDARIPAVTAQDNDKVLKVINGAYGLTTSSEGGGSSEDIYRKDIFPSEDTVNIDISYTGQGEGDDGWAGDLYWAFRGNYVAELELGVMDMMNLQNSSVKCSGALDTVMLAIDINNSDAPFDLKTILKTIRFRRKIESGADKLESVPIKISYTESDRHLEVGCWIKLSLSDVYYDDQTGLWTYSNPSTPACHIYVKPDTNSIVMNPPMMSFSVSYILNFSVASTTLNDVMARAFHMEVDEDEKTLYLTTNIEYNDGFPDSPSYNLDPIGGDITIPGPWTPPPITN